EAPLLAQAGRDGGLDDVGAIRRGGAGDIEAFAAPAIADAEPAVAHVFEVIVLVHAADRPLVDRAAVVIGPVVEIGGLAGVHRAEREVAVIATEAGIERRDVPLLVRAGRIGALLDVGAVARAGRGDLHNLAAVPIHEEVAAVDRGLHVGA